jgi:uncharacterized protein YidB (DUF937 family)
MSLLGSVLGGLLGGQTQQSPVGGILSSLLGGGTGAAGAQSGGLMNLVSRFEQAGLGNVAQSWVSNGPNQSVTPQQLQQVFGQQQVDQWAQQSNVQPHDLLSQLAHLLPQVVDGMTPQGQAQQGGIQDGMAGQDPFAAPGVDVRRT